MNIQSMLLLALVLGLFLVVGYRYIRRQRRTPDCGKCNSGSCGCCG